MGRPPLDSVDFQVTKGWNGIIFVHEGAYAGGIFKFRIDFPQRYPLNLPLVSFSPHQVLHPLVKFESGRLELASFFEMPERTSYCDANYIDGKLIRCFDGFCKEMLSKVWNIFHAPLLPA